MANIGGLSGSTSNSVSSIRGYGGLVSGLDRDSLIEGMTYGTKSKIQAQNQKKEKLQWTQNSIRNISNKLIEFSKKYASYTSPTTNLSSSSFFNKTMITALGSNSGKVTVTGNGSSASNVTITGVKQMASNASMTMNNEASAQSLNTGALSTDMTDTQTVGRLEGQNLTFGYGNKSFMVSLLSGTDSKGYTYRYDTAENAVESINKRLSEVSIGTSATDTKKLGDVVEAYKDAAGNIQLRTHGDTAGNTVTLKGGSAQAWDALGLSRTDTEQTLTTGGTSLSNKNKLTEELTLADRIGGKKLSFTYNGSTKTIELLGADDIKSGGLDALKKDLQKKLDKEFGQGRIRVSLTGNASDPTRKLEFETIRPDSDNSNLSDNDVDKSSILSLSSSDYGVLGKTGAFHVDYGTSNRLNTGSSLLDSGLTSLSPLNLDSLSEADKDRLRQQPLDLFINGVEIKDAEGNKFTYGSSISSIINAINSSDAGVKVNYLNSADKFTVEATSPGASGDIDLSAPGGATNTLGTLLFGGAGDHTIVEGKDAVVTVKYAGSNNEVELVRGSNSFSLDGMNVTVNGTFDSTATGGGDPITFSAKADTDKIVSTVTEMVESYNEIIELINKEVSTKPNRNFAPLTDEQKEGLTESEIEKWEEKAKEGLLFNDSDMRSLTEKMRFLFPSGSEDKRLLESYGISTSTSYTDNGKLVVDETKLRAAIESDTEGVQELFTRPAKTNGENDGGGFMTRISSIFNSYASTTGATKGVLVERAGSVYAPTSILKNSIQKQIDSITKYIDRLNDKLVTETDRYIKKFTQLENLISQMNSQSSSLSQFGVGA